ncbi:MAG: Stk1 family PASTA domain-containing Ser/Thr kinase [Firmicutes bacterium]|nr:Stk1 family PASTA domain-containing Ser/Thr kinase [Bacillota bacterium]
MAAVYRARCHVLNRDVAVKVLRDEYTTDEEFIKRFNIEAQAVASLTHPNIVSVYDVGHEGNLYYIVMELIKGKTLKEVIVEDGILGWKWSVKVAVQIASALETAHRNNIIHRDIKPHNIIITEDGVAKVTDFGIAKAVSNSTITAFGSTIGSVHYFSPEHARGGLTDEKSDLYSLGVVLYEMVTGRVPFDADTPVSVALKHMQEEPLEAKVLNPDLPEGVNRIITKAMQKDPGKRYSSAAEMIKDLNLVLKNPDVNYVGGVSNDFATKRIDTSEIAKSEAAAADSKNESNNKKEKGIFGKIGDFYAKHKILKILSLILVAILVFALSIGITFAVLTGSKVKEVQIPNLVNMTMNDAANKVNSLGLKINQSEEKYDPTIPTGQIISQEPPYQENFKIKEGATINVTVSKGQQMTKVPKVVGMKKEDAIKALKDANLDYKEQEDYSDTVEAGYVIQQDTADGTEAAAGSQVVIHVSKGIEQVQVPDLSGKSEADAKTAITAAKLTYKATIITNDTSKPNNVVVAQDIKAESTMAKGTAITITVNQFAEVKSANVIVNIPAFVGFTPETTDTSGATVVANVTVQVLVDGVATATKTFAGDTTNATLPITSNNATAAIVVVVTQSGSEIRRDNFTKTISGDINIP